MARQFLTPLDLNKLELRNAVIQNLSTPPSSPLRGQLYYDTDDDRLYVWNGAAWSSAGSSGVASLTVDDASIENTGTPSDPNLRVKALGVTNAMLAGSIATSKLATDPLARANHTGTQAAATISDFDAQVRTSRLDQMAAPTSAVSLNSQRVTSLATPTGASDAATKGYVDGLSSGVAWKAPVRAASTANVAIATGLENGDSLDGVTLATGDRVLLKDQTAPEENGIYVVVASGAAARAADADSAAEMLQAAVWVSEGTANADQAFVLTTNAPITLGTTGLTFVQFSGLGQVTAGAGLTKSGNSLAVGAGTGITVNADDVALAVPVTVANGGTGATDAAGAKANLGFLTRYAADVGDNSSTSIAVTHNLGTKDVLVQVYRKSDDVQVECDVTRTSTTQVTLGFAVAPATNALRAVILG